MWECTSATCLLSTEFEQRSQNASWNFLPVRLMKDQPPMAEISYNTLVVAAATVAALCDFYRNLTFRIHCECASSTHHPPAPACLRYRQVSCSFLPCLLCRTSLHADATLILSQLQWRCCQSLSAAVCAASARVTLFPVLGSSQCPLAHHLSRLFTLWSQPCWPTSLPLDGRQMDYGGQMIR